MKKNFTLFLLLFAFIQIAKAQPSVGPQEPVFPTNIKSVFSSKGKATLRFDNNGEVVTLSDNKQAIKLGNANGWENMVVNEGIGIDISEMTHIHVDVYITIGMSYLNLRFMDTSWQSSNTAAVNLTPLTTGRWIPINVKLSDFAYVPEKVGVIPWGFNINSPVYLGNVYFYKDEEPGTNLLADISGNITYAGDGIFAVGETPEATIHLTNEGEIIGADLTVDVYDAAYNFISSFTTSQVNIIKGKSQYTVLLPGLTPGFYHCQAKVQLDTETKNLGNLLQMGYKPEEIVPDMSDKQSDFDIFWQNAKADLGTFNAASDILSSEDLTEAEGKGTHNVYKVTLNSVKGHKIVGFYSEPKAAGTYPAILLSNGFSASAFVSLFPGVATFNYNIHSMGISPDDAGVDGKWETNNIEDKDNYFYRDAFLDAIRALDYLSSRPKVNTEKLVAIGASQGGGLSMAVAALDTRVKGIVAAVPFLCDFPVNRVIKESGKSTNRWPISLIYETGLTTQQQLARANTLSYIDIKNLAGLITCPVRYIVGLQDDVCPPQGKFTAYNNISAADKTYMCMRDKGHDIPGAIIENTALELLGVIPPVTVSPPTMPAPAPTQEDKTVISFYSDHYTKEFEIQYPNWGYGSGHTTRAEEIVVSGADQCLRFTGFNYQSILKENWSAIKINGMEYLHIDVWSDNLTTVKLRLQIDNETEPGYSTEKTINISGGTWTSMDIKLSDIGLTTPESVQAVVLADPNASTTPTGSIFVDNIYFYGNREEETTGSPGTSAPVPGHDQDLVTSIYSGHYNEIYNIQFPKWEEASGHTTVVSNHYIGSDEMKKFADFNYQSVMKTDWGLMSIIDMTYLHVDIWTENVPTVGVKLQSGENIYSGTEQITTTTGVWKSVDINLADLTANNIPEYIDAIIFESGDGSGTIYVDNIYFYRQYDPSAPSAPAIIPNVRMKEDVISVFSDIYATILPEGYPQFPVWAPQSTTRSDIRIKQNNIWKLESTDHMPVDLSQMDVSSMSHLHIDVWTENQASFAITLYSGAQQYETAQVSAGGGWTSIDISLDDYGLNGVSLSALNYLALTGGNGGTYYLDNIYFWKENTPVMALDRWEMNRALGKGMNLGTIFDSEYEGQYVSWDPQYIPQLASLGFKHIRLPIRWEVEGRAAETQPYAIDREFLDRMRKIVDMAIENNMKIIINLHQHDELMADPEGQKARFLAQWEQIAEYFKYYPESLLFEILNEPNADDNKIPPARMTPQLWNEFLRDGLSTIRQTNPDRMIMIQTAEMGGISGLDYLELPTDDEHIIVTIHYYNPFNFTHQGTNWAGEFPVGVEWHDTKADREAVENDFALVKSFSQNNDMPVHIGEFGVYNTADIPSRIRWATFMSRYFDRQNFSWAYWEYAGNFGIYNPENGQYNELKDALLNNPMPDPVPVKYTSIYESDFTTGFDGWTFNVVSPAVASRSVQNGYLVVESTTPGNDGYFISLEKTGLALENGETYRFSFTANSDVRVDKYLGAYLAKIYNSTDGFLLYSLYNGFLPRESEQIFSYIFTMEEASDPTARIAFDLGLLPAGTILNLKNVKVEKLDFLPKEPQEAAPLPAHNGNDVVSIFSNSYTNGMPAGYPRFTTEEGQTTETSVIQIEGNDTWKFSQMNFINIDLGGVDVSNRTHLYVDIWKASSSTLNIYLNDGVVKHETTRDLNGNEWTRLEIPLAEYTGNGVSLSNLNFIGFSNGDEGSYYVDNVYFYREIVNNKAIWTGAQDNNWNESANWQDGIVPDSEKDVYIPGNINRFPFLIGAQSSNVCKDIYFMHGAEIGRPDLLTYERAHVQLNFGLGDPEKPQQTSTDIEEHLSYAAGKSAALLSRNKWHMLSMPLRKIVTGDLTFGGYPGSFIRKFEASKPVTGNYIKGNWNDYYTTTVAEFQPAEGFIYWLNEFKAGTEKDFWVYKEYNKGNDSPISASEREYGLQQINGIVEFPYFENEDMSRAHRLHRYYPETTRSSFNGFDGDKSSSNYLQVTTDMEWFQRGDNDEAYRFIFEDTPESPNVKYTVSASQKENEEKSMLVLAGNPYMCSIDFDEFYENNKLYIKPCYHVWTESGFSTYDVITGSSSGIENIGRYIAPVQSFLVELLDEVSSADLLFNLTGISTLQAANAGTIPENNSADKQSSKINITATNVNSSVHTFIAKVQEQHNLQQNMEGLKIISALRETPEIYTLKQQEIDIVGTAYSIVGETTIEIPLVLATTQAGKTTFSFTGMDEYNADIIFIDYAQNVSFEITGKENFEYVFDYTPKVNAEQTAIPDEERFSVRIYPSSTTGDNIDYAGQIRIYSQGEYIKLVSLFDNPIKEVYIYDLHGRLMFADNINSISYNISADQDWPSTCIVKVVTEKAVVNYKHLIK